MAKGKEKAKAKVSAEAKAARVARASPTASQPPHLSDEVFADVNDQPIQDVSSGQLPPHERVRKAANTWKKLGDSYLSEIAAHGLLLDWIEGFDPENPLPEFRPAWWESRKDLPPTVQYIIHDWLKEGIIKRCPWCQSKHAVRFS